MKTFCPVLNLLRGYVCYANRKTCREGDDCPYEHDWKDVDICGFWARDVCRRPQEHCTLRHFYFEGELEKLNEKRNMDEREKVSEVQICRKWKEGKCWGANLRDGDECPYRHYYTEDDAVITNDQDESGPSISHFTSPYVVKMRKERETRRLEEVDLDTGRRRSWVETTEHDVIDLTGETPTKPRTPLSSLGVNSRAPAALVEKPLKSPLLNPTSTFSFPTSKERRELRSDAIRRYGLTTMQSDHTTMQSGTRRRPSLRN